MGALLEARAFHPSRTARAHLTALAAGHGIGQRRVEEVLAVTGIEKAADSRVGKFSLGRSQRLGIAAASLGDPGVLLLDEPVNGLDPEGIRWIRNLLKNLATQGRALLASRSLGGWRPSGTPRMRRCQRSSGEMLCNSVRSVTAHRNASKVGPSRRGRRRERVLLRVELRLYALIMSSQKRGKKHRKPQKAGARPSVGSPSAPCGTGTAGRRIASAGKSGQDGDIAAACEAAQLVELVLPYLVDGRMPANVCVDACMTLRHAYGQLGVRSELLSVDLAIRNQKGIGVRYGSLTPKWTGTSWNGHCVLVLPDSKRFVDATVEQFDEIRAVAA